MAAASLEHLDVADENHFRKKIITRVMFRTNKSRGLTRSNERSIISQIMSLLEVAELRRE